MLISELVSALNRVTQLAGDIPVVLKDVETEAETVLLSLGIKIDPAADTASSSVTIEHGPAPEPVTPAPATEPTPTEQAA